MKMHERQGCTVKNGSLEMDGLPLNRLAGICGTPLYVYSQSVLEENLKTYVQNFKSSDFETRVVYASKAFNVMEMLKLAEASGCSIDTVSLVEMITALKAGIDMKKVILHGNNKSDQEMAFAFIHEIGALVCDTLEEAEKLAVMARDFPDKKLKVLLRINPGIECHTHEYIQTASPDSKFGLYIAHIQEIDAAIQALCSAENLEFAGFHAHIGSQIYEIRSWLDEIEILAQFAAKTMQRLDVTIDTLDLGGGFAAWYQEDDPAPAIEEVCQALISKCEQVKRDVLPSLKSVWIEPGRSIVCNAGLTLYTIDQIKKTENKTWYFADGGMNDNIRPALYQAVYSCDLVDKTDQPKDTLATIAGKCCESGDLLAVDVKVQKAEPKDLLAVWSTGAYGYSMASHYNKMPVPPVVFVKDGKARYVVRPETPEEMLAREVSEDIYL